jgi:hypothetical protein
VYRYNDYWSMPVQKMIRRIQERCKWMYGSDDKHDSKLGNDDRHEMCTHGNRVHVDTEYIQSNNDIYMDNGTSINDRISMDNGMSVDDSIFYCLSFTIFLLSIINNIHLHAMNLSILYISNLLDVVNTNAINSFFTELHTRCVLIRSKNEWSLSISTPYLECTLSGSSVYSSSLIHI